MKRDHLVIPGWVDEGDGFDYADLLRELGIGGTAVDLVEVLRDRWNDEVVSHLEAEDPSLGNGEAEAARPPSGCRAMPAMRSGQLDSVECAEPSTPTRTRSDAVRNANG